MKYTFDNMIKPVVTLAPLFASCILIAVQWGSVTQRMNSFENTQLKQTELIEETRDALVSVKTDVSYMKGRMKGND